MAKSTRIKNSPLSNDCCLYIEGSLFAFLFFWCHWSYAGPSVSNRDDHNFIPRVFGEMGSDRCSNPTPILRFDPPDTTFYDDPDLRYSIDKKITGWDDKRKEWLKQNPTFSAVGAAKHRVVMVTGSQLKPCRNPIGDYLLLRAFKNKVDYYWIHRIDIFYNNVLLHPKMPSFWVKLPVVKAAMVAHPKVEWIWWVDSAALITNLEFKLPLDRYDYKSHNLVVHWWEKLICKEKSWTSLRKIW